MTLVAFLVNGCAAPAQTMLPSSAAPPTTVANLSPATEHHLLYVLDPRNGSTETQVLVVDPDAQRIVHTIPAAYDPQIAVAPAGRRLYLTDTPIPPGAQQAGTDMLNIIETGTWRIIERLESPDRIKHKVYGRDAMSFSPDGLRLFIHKWKILEGRYQGSGGYSAPRADHWWDIFEPATGKFALNPPHVTDCGIAQALFAGDSRTLVVLCHQRNDLVFVDLMNGNTTGTISIGPSAGAVRSADGKRIYVVSTNGHVFIVDTVRAKIERTLTLNLPSERRVAYAPLALSLSGNQLYVGIGQQFAGADASHEIWSVDLQSGQHIKEYRAGQGAFTVSFALSPDGKRLYSVNPARQTLTIFDATGGRELAVMQNVGETPALILVAPKE